MIEDFFKSKIFPKFYLKTQDREIFALGKSAQNNNVLVGFIPTGKTYKHFFKDGLYTPNFFEVRNYTKPLIFEPLFKAKPCHFTHDITLKEWTKRLQLTKNAIKNSLIQKAVLKRTTTFKFKNEIPIERYFKTYALKTSKLNQFFIQQDESSAFMGATPELLFERTNKCIKTMALAATIPSKLDLENLVNDSKMMKEFNFVKLQIQEMLREISKDIKVGVTEPKTFYHLTHLFAEIEAHLNEIDDHQLIHLLHPTAAIIGLPRKEAINYVESLEKSPRNLYSCALGYSTEAKAEFFVGIRSLFIQQNLLHAFCGVGIVEESDPLKEWKELNLKLKAVKIWMGK